MIMNLFINNAIGPLQKTLFIAPCVTELSPMAYHYLPNLKHRPWICIRGAFH